MAKSTDYYYRKMQFIRYSVFYLNLHLDCARRWNRGSEFFIAAFSLGGVGAWGIWDKVPWLWAIIIAGMQLYSLANLFLWHAKRVDVLSRILEELEPLANFAEENWCQITQGTLTESKIISLNKELYERNSKACRELKTLYLPDKKKFIKKANQDTLSYLNHFSN